MTTPYKSSIILPSYCSSLTCSIWLVGSLLLVYRLSVVIAHGCVILSSSGLYAFLGEPIFSQFSLICIQDSQVFISSPNLKQLHVYISSILRIFLTQYHNDLKLEVWKWYMFFLPCSHKSPRPTSTCSLILYSMLGWCHHLITGVRKWELPYTFPSPL